MSEKDFVITGISGRFPLSANVDEFCKNLYDGTDMVTQSEDRWPDDTYGIANRMGRIPNFRDFDGNYFGIVATMAENIDPPGRLILEAAHEAIIDAGINPQSIRGSNTGVYVGFSHYPGSEGLLEEVQPDWASQKSLLAFRTMSNLKSLLANRISFLFDFKGPSITTDTACSASLSAFTLAINDLLLGRVDNALVGGVHMTLEPCMVQMQQESGICSPRGVSAVLDETADGFVKSDAVACVFLQRRSIAKRVYATVRSAQMNVDGYKKVGQFFPSAEAQEALMVKSYKEAGIDPLDLTFFEGHLTGTRVGDPEEIKAIYNAYCAIPGRKEPLPLGCVKGNIGHTEGCSGLSSLIKVLLAFEKESLPPNINIKELKHEIKEFCPPLYPNREVIPYKPGLAGINNFGVGGVNVHVLVEPNYKLSSDDNLKIAEEMPRIINVCGRTEEAVKNLFDFIENNADKVTRDFLALIGNTMKCTPNINSAGFPYRGSIVIKKVSENQMGIKYEYKKQLSEMKSKTLKPIWFLFPGLGGQWTAMAKALMPIEIFRNKVEECHQILSEFGVDLKNLLLSEDKTAISTMTAKFCATTAIEMALFEILKALEITPDGIIGHSFGEIACAYADGCLTTREAMITTYVRGAVTEKDKNIPKSLMAVCGISKNEAKKLLTNDVVIACYNARNTIVLSGPEEQIKKIMTDLKAKNIFVFQLESNGIPYHHPYLKTSAQPMLEQIKKHLPNPKLRSKKWISTSIPDEQPSEDILNYASAEYFVNNLISPVYFYDKFRNLPSDAIIVEVGPHGVFRKIVSETLESASYLTLIKKDSNDTNLDNVFSAIAKLYELGVNPSIENLYSRVEFPVSRSTAGIGSLMRWDHRAVYNDKKYPDYFNRSTAADMNITIDLKLTDKSFYTGHCIDGSILFPATGYLMLAWRIYASTLGKIWIDVPVVFEQVQFKRAVFLNDQCQTHLKVVYARKTGDFTILENENECARGKVHGPIDEHLILQSLFYENQNRVFENEINITKEDIYKDLRVRGYDYSGEFQKLRQIRTNDYQTLLGVCEWDGNTITFLDNLFQAQMLALPFRKLMVPVMVKNMRIDPKVLYEAIRHNKIVETEPRDELSDEALGQHNITIDSDIRDVRNDVTNVKDVIDQHKQKFHHFNSFLPFYFDGNTRILVAPGIEIENVLAFPIPRKLPNTLNIDSYEFVANEDNNAIDECDKKDLIEYLEVCKSMSVKLKQKGLNQLKCDFNYQHICPEVIERQRHDNSDRKVILKTLDKLNQTDENKNILKLDSIQSMVKDIQNDMNRDIVNEISKNERLIRTIVDIVSENNATKKEYKVVEINRTHDILGKEVEAYLANSQLMPTDVDYKLFVQSIDYVSDNLKEKATEWDGKEVPQLPSCDLIILRDTQDLWSFDNLVKQINSAVVDNGFLIVIGRYRLTEPEEALNSLIKPNGNKIITNLDLEKRLQTLVQTIGKSGLNLIASKSDSISTMALMFRKVTEKKKIPENRNIIEITAERNEKWFEAIRDCLFRSKEAIDSGIDSEKFWLIARDTDINGLIGLMNCLRLEPGGEHLRCIFDMDCNIKLPIDWTSKPFSDILNNDLVINVLKDGRLGTYRHIKLPKDCDKVLSRDYFLNTGANKDLSNLTWYDKKNLIPSKTPVDWSGRLIGLTSVNIYTSGLIFKDVMFATGRIPTGQMGLFTDCVIGLEFAGRRADTGGRVMGFTESRGFASSINANKNWLTSIPEHWSMDDAVTILSTYSTLWYGLIKRGGLVRGESVLIHSGAGGIGQSAINMCKHYECDIYVTVGTEEKKQFLAKEFGIPEHKIYSSRDIQFKYKIMRLTKGRGVDLVVNSLTGEKLDAGYELLAKGGRFVEIGKFDMVNNKQLSMFEFLKDISFIGISVDIALFDKPLFAKEFFDWMHENCNNGCVKPYNKIVFNANEAEKAFRYMTTGKHIGKIVLRIRDEEKDRQPLKTIKPAPEMMVTRKTYFNPNKVYVITGGLGGFGLELIHWMIFMGARKFVLTSRNGIKNDYQNFVINRLRLIGEELKFFDVMIEVLKENSLTLESAQQVLNKASELGQIGGIFHLGIILNDCLLEKLTFDKFCESIDCKYKVFDNLDKLTRKLSYHLDYFVIFSSVTCGKGNAGQTNYSFGNSLCERICEQRRRDGLHGLAVQYGPVGDVGVFESASQVLEMSTLQKQRIHSCCDVLDKLLTVENPIITSYVKSERIVQSGGRQRRMIKNLWRALGIDPSTTPDHLTLGEIGLESMFAVELQQELEREFNLKIAINNIKAINVKMLKDYEAGKADNIRKYLDDLGAAKEMLNKYKFLIPTETHSRLNNVMTGKPIYFMPPFEITFSPYEEFAKKFSRPVIGLNWTRDMSQFETMKEINQYFTDLLKKLEPKGDYDLVGCLDGAVVVSKQLLKGRVNRAVIVDVICDNRFNSKEVTDEFLLEFVFRFLSQDLPESFRDKVYREIQSEPSLKAKVRRIVNELKDFSGRALIATDLEEIFHLAIKRTKIVNRYWMTKKKRFSDRLKQRIGQKWAKKTGKLFLIKPFKYNRVEDPDIEVDKCRDVYLLPDEEDSADILSVEGLDFHNAFAITSEQIGNKIIEKFI